MPFRKAHEVVGGAVRYCIDHGKRLEGLPLEELRQFSDLIGEDVFEVLPIEKCVQRRRSLGGTSPDALPAQLAQATASLERQGSFAAKEREAVRKAFAALVRSA